MYIDQNTFVNCSRLKNLYLHNNRLKSASSILKDSLPSLKTLHLYNNELECVCNARWRKQENIKELDVLSAIAERGVPPVSSQRERERERERERDSERERFIH